MSSSDLRLHAREALRGNWLTAVLVAFLFGLLGGGNSSGSANVELSEEQVQAVANLPAELSGIIFAVFGFLATFALLFTVIHLILGGALSMGSAQYNLNLIDGYEASLSDLFSQFYRFVDGLVMNLLTGLFVFLWSLLLVIPGIVASYSYAMAPYILVENPGCSGSEAIRRSKELMKGHKGELFLLDLSFIGWGILATLTLGIGYLFLNPYTHAARAAFYRSLVQPIGYTTVEY